MKNSLIKRVFGIYSTICLVIIVSLGGYLFMQVRQRVIGNYEQAMSMNIEAYANRVHDMSKRLSFSMQLLNNSGSAFGIYADRYNDYLIEDIKNYESLKREFIEYIQLAMDNNTMAYHAYFFIDPSRPLSNLFADYKGENPVEKKIDGTRFYLYHSEKVGKESWYQRAVENLGTEYWFSDESVPNQLYMAKQMIAYDNDGGMLETHVTGVILVGINLNFLWEFGTDGNERIMIGDKKGNNLAWTGGEPLEAAVWKQVKPGKLTYVSGEEAHYYVETFEDSSFLNTTVIVKTEELEQQLKNTLQIMILIGVALLAFTLILLWFMSKRLLEPIRKLSDHMAEEELLSPVVYNERYDDEIFTLYNSFNQLTDRIKALLSDKEKATQEKIEAQFEILQAQINPHFVYNTLDSACCMALLGETDSMVYVLGKLADIMRYNISKGDRLTTVNQELQVISDYMDIQKCRWQERIQVMIEVEEKFGLVKLPKSTLQPLIENAIDYGMKSRVSPLQIKISTYETENGKIILKIQDSGKNADVDRLNKYLHGEAEINHKGTGLGIRNVDRRIKLVFGEEYGLTYQKSNDGETIVCIYIPKLK